MKSYYVYVLRSKLDNKFYTGFTSDLEKRFEEHNTGKVYSTKARLPFEIVYYEYVFVLMMQYIEKNILKQLMVKDILKID